MINKAILVGRLTKDPELRSTNSGISVCAFSVAVPRKYAKQGTERQTDFINCVAWRQTAEFISRYFKKGNLISIDGSIQTRNYDDKDGKRVYVTEIVVDDARFVEGKKDSAPPEEFDGGDPLGDIPSSYDEADDLPF